VNTSSHIQGLINDIYCRINNVMKGSMSITELADTAGVSRRAVRFYVARKLLLPPEGRGRGGYYTAAHLDQLRRIQELQRAGHPLEAIRRILDGADVKPPPAPVRTGRVKAGIQASLWTRLVLDTGIELHIDLNRHEVTAEQILALKESVRPILAGEVSLDVSESHAANSDPQRSTQ
jgi:DNA-binding transcriptional MerR regulator